MKRDINITVANAAGNITIFVHDHFEREQYQAVASKLLDIEELGGEQVAFILPPKHGSACNAMAVGRMEMCGLEFCGNASRALALIVARENKIQGAGQIAVDVSGCSKTLIVDIDTLSGNAKIEMPQPIGLRHADLSHLPFTRSSSASTSCASASSDSASAVVDSVPVVDFGGIIHYIVKDIEPTMENFELIKNSIPTDSFPPALGVMFYNTSDDFLTPAVYVSDVETTYFEGSCGSGTTACAAAFSEEKPDGVHTYTLRQPRGTIIATVLKEQGALKGLYIESVITLSPERKVTI